MAPASSEIFHHDNLRIVVTEVGPTMRVVWLGTSEVGAPGEPLIDFLSQLAERLRNRKVMIDFRKCEYMNSATISPIIQFLKQLDANRAETLLLYDEYIDWQRINFVCLKMIAKRLPMLTVQGV